MDPLADFHSTPDIDPSSIGPTPPPTSVEEAFFNGLGILGDRVDSLAKAMETLTQFITAREQRDLARTEQKPSAKVPEPTKFTGRAADVDRFLEDVQLNFKAQSSALRTDDDKISYTAAFFKDGSPREWFSVARHNGAAWLTKWDLFEAEFRRRFGDPDLKNTKMRQLQALTQTKSAADYAAVFADIAGYLDLTDETKRTHFYDGLKDSVKDAISLLPKPMTPSTYDELVEFAVHVDNQHHRREQERRRAGRGPRNPPAPAAAAPPAPVPPPPAANVPVPMEIDATRIGHPRGRLSDAERTRRIENHLCLYCGGPGHRSGPDCPALAARDRARASGKATPAA